MTTIKFDVPGKKRKELVQTIAGWLGEDIKYCGAPTFAYEIDYFTSTAKATFSSMTERIPKLSKGFWSIFMTRASRATFRR